MAGLLSKGITLGYVGAEAYNHRVLEDMLQYEVRFTNADDTTYALMEQIPTSDLIGAAIHGGSSGTFLTTVKSVRAEATGGYTLTGANNQNYSFSKIDMDTVNKADDAGVLVELTNLQEMAELGNNAPEKIDVTVLSDAGKKTINGLVDYSQDLAFKFLYEKEQFNQLAGLKNSCEWEVTLPDGTKANFTATPSVKLDGAGVSAALTYTLTLSVESLIVFA